MCMIYLPLDVEQLTSVSMSVHEINTLASVVIASKVNLEILIFTSAIQYFVIQLFNNSDECLQ
jgi:hypothetical protein